VHNHVAMEVPRMIFVHATGTSDIDTLTSEAKAVLDALNAQDETRQESSLTVSANDSNNNQNATATSSAVGGNSSSTDDNNNQTTTSGADTATDNPGSESDNPFSSFT
jgi:hypothetical protein